MQKIINKVLKMKGKTKMAYFIYLTEQEKQKYLKIKLLLKDNVENFNSKHSESMNFIFKIIKIIPKKDIKELFEKNYNPDDSIGDKLTINILTPKRSVERVKEAELKEALNKIKGKLKKSLPYKPYPREWYNVIFTLVLSYLNDLNEDKLSELQELNQKNIKEIKMVFIKHNPEKSNKTEIPKENIKEVIENKNNDIIEKNNFVLNKIELLKVFVDPNLHETFEKFIKEIDKEINDYISNK